MSSEKHILNEIFNIPCILKLIQYLGRTKYLFLFLAKIMDVLDLIPPWFLLLFPVTKVRNEIKFCFQQFK